jgi:hypothetical protein
MKFPIRRLTLASILFFSFSSLAIEIPKRLDAQDRREVARILGLNTSSKILSNPYPLGGYSGVEIGVSLEVVNIEDLSRLGCQPGEAGCPTTQVSEDKELKYPRISIGKGLYKNIDFFLNFVPPMHDDISDFGGMARWSFFHAKFLPINLSLLAHANRMNIKDALISENVGAEILAGVNVNNFAFYFGGGYLRSEVTFLGGDGQSGSVDAGDEQADRPADPKLNRDTNTLTETIYSTHSLVGVSVHFSDIFAAFQIDRYRDPVMSFKLGVRY